MGLVHHPEAQSSLPDFPARGLMVTSTFLFKMLVRVLIHLVFFVTLGGAPNYYPNSFSGPLDHPTHSLSKTIVVNIFCHLTAISAFPCDIIGLLFKAIMPQTSLVLGPIPNIENKGGTYGGFCVPLSSTL